MLAAGALLVCIILICTLMSQWTSHKELKGGEQCKCDPTGDELKRCPNVPCKELGLELKGFTSNSKGDMLSPILSTIHTGTIDYDFGSRPILGTGRNNNVRLNFTGFIKAPITGTVQFRVQSDDGTILLINGAKVVDIWWVHGPMYAESPAIAMTMGQYYPIDLRYYQAGGGGVLRLHWRYGGSGYSPVPAEYMRH